MTALVEFLSDRLNIRGPSAAGLALVAAIGYILLSTSTTVGVRYFMLFLSVHILISVALGLTWVGNTCDTLEERWSTGLY